VDNLQWVVTSLIGIVVTFGGIILAGVQKDIARTEEAIKELHDKLNEVKIPNVGVSMCEEIQEKYDNKHEMIKEAFTFFEKKCENLNDRSRANREAMLKFEGKLDLILEKVENISKCS